MRYLRFLLDGEIILSTYIYPITPRPGEYVVVGNDRLVVWKIEHAPEENFTRIHLDLIERSIG